MTNTTAGNPLQYNSYHHSVTSNQRWL